MRRSSGVACWKGCVSVLLAVLMVWGPRVVVGEEGGSPASRPAPAGAPAATQAGEGAPPAVAPPGPVDAGAGLESEYARREAEARDLESFAGGESDAFVSFIYILGAIAVVAIVVVLLMIGAEGGGGGGGYDRDRDSGSTRTSDPPRRRTHTCNICGGSGYSGQSSDRKCGMCNGTGVTPWTREE